MFAASNSQIMGFGDIIKNVLDFVFSNTIGQIFRPIINYINTAYFFICKTAYSAFLLPIGRVMDIIQMIFRKFAGIDSMTIKNLNRNRFFGAFGNNGDIVYDLISSDIVQRIFFAMMILAIILLIVTTFVANIKSEFNSYEKGGNIKTKVFKNAFKGLINFIAVPVISIFAIILSNGLLRTIDGATQINGAQTYLSGQLFVACGYNANRARNSQLIDENGEASYVENSFGALLTDVNWTGKEGAWGVRYLSSGAGYANFGIFLDDAQSGLQYANGANSQTGMGYGFRAADKIDTAFATGLSLDVKEDSKATQLYYGPALDFWYGGMDLISSSASFILSGAGTAPGGYTTFPEGYKMSFGAFGDAAGAGTNLWGFLTGEGPTFVLKYATNTGWANGVNDYGHISFSIYDTALVFYYYDLGLTNFSYIIFIIAGAYFCYVLLVTSVGLIKRMFMVTTLFIISPPVCALYPIDEGKALERWRKNFVQELTSAYATIIVMNIFLSLLPLFTSIEVFGTGYLSKRVLQLFPLYTWGLDPNTFEQSVVGTFAGNASSAVMFVVCGFLNAIARLLIIVGALHFFTKANKAIAEVLGTGNAFDDGKEVAAKLAKTISGTAALAVGGGAMMAAKAKKKAVARGNADNGGDAPKADDGQASNETNINPDENKSLEKSKSDVKKDSEQKPQGDKHGSEKPKDKEQSSGDMGFYNKFATFAKRAGVIKDVLTGKSGAVDVIRTEDKEKNFGFASASRESAKYGAILKQRKNQAKEARAAARAEARNNLKAERLKMKEERDAQKAADREVANKNRLRDDKKYRERKLARLSRDLNKEIKNAGKAEKKKKTDEANAIQKAQNAEKKLNDDRVKAKKSVGKKIADLEKKIKDDDKVYTARDVRKNREFKSELNELKDMERDIEEKIQEYEKKSKDLESRSKK